MIENEQTFLGLVLLNPKSISKVTQVKAHEFEEPLHGKAWSEILKAYFAGMQSSPMSLAAKFKDELTDIGKDYFVSLVKQITIAQDVESLAQSIRDEYTKRQVRDICSEALTDELELEDLCDKLHHLQTGLAVHQIKDSANVLATIYDDLNNDLPIFNTGLESLNTAMGGGMIQGRAYGIAAKKKVGKTTMLGTIASNMANNGVNVLYVALEMGAEQIMHRIAGRAMGLNPINFINERRKHPDFKKQLAEYITRSDINLKFLDIAGVTLSSLQAILTPMVRKHKIEVVIIDYWQLIGGKKNSQSQAEHQDAVAQWIAEFSKKERVATLTASQINQQGNTRGGEGMRLAFDQVYQMHVVDENNGDVWLQMMDTRYTVWQDLGNENQAAFRLNTKGVYFEEIPCPDQSAKY